MLKVLCLDDNVEYFFNTTSAYDALQKMLYTLNLKHEDKNAKIDLCNGRTWCLTHNGKTYGCIM